MIIFVFLMCVVAVGLVVYAFIPFNQTPGKVKDSRKSDKAPIKEQKASMLESKIIALEDELRKTKIDYVAMQKEFDTVKQKEAELNAQIQKHKDWLDKKDNELAKASEQAQEFKKKFESKEKELTDEFSKNVKVNKELRES